MSPQKTEFITYYEDHSFFNSQFPIAFHFDVCPKGVPFSKYQHWHENIEILYFVEGEGILHLGSEEIHTQKGDIAVVNSNTLHGFDSATDVCKYYCLIIDKSLYEAFGIQAGRMFFNEVIRDNGAVLLYKKIIKEWQEEKEHFLSAIKLYSLDLLLYLSRNHIEEKTSKSSFNDKRIETVKSAISYIRTHFNKEITIDDICGHIGLSKYYFCRVFKEITHRTPVEYINFVRCHNARNLILSGKYNVSESAELSGFKNLSYFTRTYKKIFGSLPSKKI